MQQHVGHQTGDTQEQQRKQIGELTEGVDVHAQQPVRRLLRAGEHLRRAVRGGQFPNPGDRVGTQRFGQADHHLIGGAGGQRGGQRLGGEEDAEVVGQREHVATAARGPEVFGRGGHARDGHLAPPAGPEHGQRCAAAQPEVIGHMVFDQHLVRTRVVPGQQRRGVHRGRPVGGQADDAAAQFVGPDPQRQIDLRAHDRIRDPRHGVRPGRECGRVPAAHPDVGETFRLEGAVIGGVQIPVGPVGRGEQRHAEHDDHRLRGELRPLSTHVAQQFPA
ncbi:hypothetical protein [Nocardia brasiliensis]|uniref:hypothetical protein n=1 Tax=Nocardia brasiliensis TaxID=37326 RepID=UPI002456AC75|nr:hypothetical protein [Nocardia brasiliensis]